jgi:hypothetical protein
MAAPTQITFTTTTSQPNPIQPRIDFQTNSQTHSNTHPHCHRSVTTAQASTSGAERKRDELNKKKRPEDKDCEGKERRNLENR